MKSKFSKLKSTYKNRKEDIKNDDFIGKLLVVLMIIFYLVMFVCVTLWAPITLGATIYEWAVMGSALPNALWLGFKVWMTLIGAGVMSFVGFIAIPYFNQKRE